MALIDCPECGAQVSDRAPTCPHCGVPIASGATSTQPSSATAAQGSVAEPASANRLDASIHDTVEPFRLRLAGRPLPIAGLLFWGGMVVGLVLKAIAPPSDPETETEFWRYLPWLMIWCGVLWFAVTEFGALIKNKLNKQR